MTDDDRALPEWEEQHPKMTGRTAADVRAELGFSFTRYVQRLHERCAAG